ncbi:MAG TPA: ROK family protein [Bacteroidia bacterium]|nr:ROK family protein [Bacteroidia bacterium]
MMTLVSGIDIGGTNTEIGIVDKDGNILFTETISTTAFATPEAYVQAIEIILKKGQVKCATEILAIGIGAPSANYFSGCIEHAPNMPWKGIIPLAEMLVQATGKRTVITNDANAAALGEMIFGAAKFVKDFLLVTLGTGLGSGFVVNNEVVYGHDGFAGELGHVIIEEGGRQCGCGRKGCLETYVSATGVVWSAHDAIRSGKTIAGVTSIEKITARMIAEAAEAGDETAKAIIDEIARKLGLALANAVCITSPSHIYLFGGVARSGDTILVPTRKYFNQYLLRNYAGKVSIELSALPENAAVLGAAALAWKEIS